MALQSEAANSPMVSDGKKRAMEALERRFAAAKAELLQEQHHNSSERKRTPKDTIKAKEPGASLASLPHPDLTSDKGHSVFSGHTSRRETPGTRDAESHPAYSDLSQMVHENLLPAGTKDSCKREAVDEIVQNILQNGDEGHKFKRGTRSIKIDYCLLLDNFVPKDSSSMNARVKALRLHSKRSQKHMSMRQHRKCGSLVLSKEFHKFDLFKPMHEMWKEYIIELLKATGKKQLPQCLLMADLHGAILQVVECKTTAFKGVTGIMVRETAETFGVVTQDNRFRVVPKRGSVFIFQAGCWRITLHGDKLSLRNTST